MPDLVPTTTEPQATGTTVQPATPPAAPAAPAPAPSPAPAQSPRTFNQEEVNAIVRDRLNEDRARRPAAAATQPAAQAPATPPQAAPAATAAPSASLSATDVQQMIARHGQFVRAVTEAGLNAGQQSLMERALQHENPPDVVVWAKEWITTMGLGKPAEPTATTPATATPAPTAAPTAPPAAAPTAPTTSTLPTSAGIVDYFSLDVSQINQLGPAGLRELHERAKKVGQQIAGAPARPKAPPPTR